MLKLYNDYWESFIENIKLFEGVIDFLMNCREKEIKVALVTDLTADVQLKKVARLGLSGYIDALVTSEEAGAEKPDLSIFRLALKKIELAPEDVWVIGDNIEKDIVGGNLLGAATVYFAFDRKAAMMDNDRKNPSITVNGFREIISMLNE
jgi:putative hydrolase of the HAD superfamily